MSGAAKPTSHQNPEPEQDLVSRQSPAGPAAIQEDFSPVAELIALERERIASRDRRTDIARRAIEAGDAADQRQYDYHVEKLRLDDDDRKRWHASGIAIVWTLLAAAIVFTGFLCWMLFAGDEAQRVVANRLLGIVLTGLGGFGIGSVLLNGIRRFLAR